MMTLAASTSVSVFGGPVPVWADGLIPESPHPYNVIDLVPGAVQLTGKWGLFADPVELKGFVQALKAPQRNDASDRLNRLVTLRVDLLIHKTAHKSPEANSDLLLLSQTAPEIFDRRHIADLAKVARYRMAAAEALWNLVTQRAELFRAEDISPLRKAADRFHFARWTLAILLAKRPEMFPQAPQDRRIAFV